MVDHLLQRFQPSVGSPALAHPQAVTRFEGEPGLGSGNIGQGDISRSVFRPDSLQGVRGSQLVASRLPVTGVVAPVNPISRRSHLVSQVKASKASIVVPSSEQLDAVEVLPGEDTLTDPTASREESSEAAVLPNTPPITPPAQPFTASNQSDDSHAVQDDSTSPDSEAESVLEPESPNSTALGTVPTDSSSLVEARDRTIHPIYPVAPLLDFSAHSDRQGSVPMPIRPAEQTQHMPPKATQSTQERVHQSSVESSNTALPEHEPSETVRSQSSTFPDVNRTAPDHSDQMSLRSVADDEPSTTTSERSSVSPAQSSFPSGDHSPSQPVSSAIQIPTVTEPTVTKAIPEPTVDSPQSPSRVSSVLPAQSHAAFSTAPEADIVSPANETINSKPARPSDILPMRASQSSSSEAAAPTETAFQRSPRVSVLWSDAEEMNSAVISQSAIAAQPSKTTSSTTSAAVDAANTTALPTIEITIGRIDIRAAPSPSTAKRPRRSPNRPSLSLSDYLDRRNRT